MNKVCYRCKNEYPATLEFFAPNNNKPAGLQYECRVCHRARSREYYRKNKESCLERIKRNAEKCADAYGETKRKYYQKHKKELHQKRMKRPNFKAQSAKYSANRRARIRH